jgi:PAS domain S-box-containing protein
VWPFSRFGVNGVGDLDMSSKDDRLAHPPHRDLSDSTDQLQISLTYQPPTPRQTRLALLGAAVLLLGLAVLAPYAAEPLPHVNGFIPALDATTFITNFITAGLLFAHFSITRSSALLALAYGYLFSALIVVAHGLSFPGAFSPAGNFGGSSQTTVRLYLFWHLGFPATLFAYVWLKDEDHTKAGAHMPAALLAICSVAGISALVGGIVWLSAAGDGLLPPAVIDPVHAGPIMLWLIALTMLICAAALFVLWMFQRSALDQWLMVVVLASIVELAITALFGGPRFTLGFYAGRVFSLVTSTLVLTALLAETTRLYAGLARANILAGVIKASQTLSSEIEPPKLIEQLMTIAIENAGADRGLLILPSGNEYLIQAEARATGNQIEVAIRQQLITGTTCPESLVRHVIRTQETVIIDDTAAPNLFPDDDYLRDRGSKSILCLPLVKQRHLIGVLLLENALASHAFTPARIAVLELLAAQAVISLENTRLYTDLQEREAKVRRLVDSNIVGICIFDLDGGIIEANEAFLRTVGYGQDDLMSGRLRWTDLTPPEWRGADQWALDELAFTGTCKPFEKEYFRKDGSRVRVLLACAMFGEIRHRGVSFILDLTERKQAEAALREAERRNLDAQLQLAHANRITTMGQLAASIAHEVNQPIGATLVNAGTALRWLRASPPNLDDARQSIDRIITDGKRATDIVSRIRDLAKKAPVQREGLEVNEVVLEVIGLARSEMSSNGVLVQTRLTDGLPRIWADRVQLQQVILNLIVNAVEAMSDATDGSRELSISTSRAEAEGVLVTVSDSGPGLPPANPERVFEAFYTTKASGLGMGLSICRSIIEAHGGRLRALPNRPRGAAFRITLPAGDDSLENP